MDKPIRFSRGALAIMSALAMCLGTGCSIEFAQEAPRSVDDPPPEEIVTTIRFRNYGAIEAVDVEFYAATTALADLPADLMVPDNRIQSSVGVAGTGIITPLSEDVIEYPCSADLTVGTAGGQFLDNETGAVLGVGQPRWAEEGPLNLCGHTITFEFYAEGGVYMTLLSLSR